MPAQVKTTEDFKMTVYGSDNTIGIAERLTDFELDESLIDPGQVTMTSFLPLESDLI